MEAEAGNSCPLCDRPLARPFNRHHLMPLSKGGKNTPTVLLHKICHDKIHAVFSGKELKRHYHTIDRLKEHEAMARFLLWVRQKAPEFYDASVKMKR